MVEDLPVPPGLAAGLAPLLHDLLAAERLAGQCVEQVESADRASGVAPRLIAFGISRFLAVAVAEAFIERPTAKFGLEILQRCRRDEGFAGLLGAGAVAKANAGDGLNLFPFCWLQRPRDKSSPLGSELMAQRMKLFLSLHTGYNLKRILKEGTREDEPVLASGGFIRLKAFAGPASETQRLLFVLTREQADHEAYGSALSLLFSAARPRLRLTRIQQHVLLSALDDLSDDEIADHLNISRHAVNMRWRTIYDRILQHPELAAAIFDHRDAGNGGGAHTQKRRRVTAFVRAHPEELRPFAP